MRVILGRQSLGALGGTETYALTVARELDRLGHDVTLAAEEFGLAADVARGRGIRVARMDELPSECDAVIAHDLPMAAILAERYPDARRVYVVHADGWDLQLPPVVPGVVHAVVACSDPLAARVRALPLEAPIVRLREPIDTDGSVYPRALPERPRRALILSNYLQGPRRRVLLDVWGSAGVECTQAGTPTQVVVDPKAAFEAADIVVGKGRVVLEAMCAGCAVRLRPVRRGRLGPPRPIPRSRLTTSPARPRSRPRRAIDLAADLEALQPGDGNLDNDWFGPSTEHDTMRSSSWPSFAAPTRASRTEPRSSPSSRASPARAAARELRIAEFWNRMSAAEARGAGRGGGAGRGARRPG